MAESNIYTVYYEIYNCNIFTQELLSKSRQSEAIWSNSKQIGYDEWLPEKMTGCRYFWSEATLFADSQHSDTLSLAFQIGDSSAQGSWRHCSASLTKPTYPRSQKLFIERERISTSYFHEFSAITSSRPQEQFPRQGHFAASVDVAISPGSWGRNPRNRRLLLSITLAFVMLLTPRH